MANGFVQRFLGKIAVKALWLGSGGIIDALSGIAAKARVAQRLTATVTATANTDYTMSLPTGATIVGITAYTTTAFLAATDAKFQAGLSAGDATYVAATSIKAAGAVAMVLAGAGQGSMPAGTPNLFMRIVQSGAASATGAATIVVEYVMA